MDDLSAPLRTMKRIIILLLALMPIVASAQDYKKLDSIEVPDYPGNEIYISKSTTLPAMHTAAYALATKGINATIAPENIEYDFYFRIDDAIDYKGMTARLWIGGETYYKTVFYANENSVYIDLTSENIEHIAVSGLQGVDFLSGAYSSKHQFNDIEQELWRRTAEAITNLKL